MKKIISIALILSMVFCLSSCGKANKKLEIGTTLVVNEIDEVTELELDKELVPSDSIPDAYGFIYNTIAPIDFALDDIYEIFGKAKKGVEEAHDIIFHFSNQKDREYEFRCSIIDEPYPVVSFNDKKAEKSKINGTTVYLFRHGEDDFYAKFKYDDVYFFTIFKHIDQNAVQTILESICLPHY